MPFRTQWNRANAVAIAILTPFPQKTRPKRRTKNLYVNARTHTSHTQSRTTSISIYIIKYVIYRIVCCPQFLRAAIPLQDSIQPTEGRHGSAHTHRVCSYLAGIGYGLWCGLQATRTRHSSRQFYFIFFSFHISRGPCPLSMPNGLPRRFLLLLVRRSLVQLGPLSPLLLHIKSNCNPLNGSCHALTVCERARAPVCV